MPIFIIFEPRLLPQLDEKRCKGEKCKTAIKLSREVKQTVLIVGGGWISDFTVEREKSYFCDS